MSPPTVATPDTLGRYGPFGGRYVPETLMAALEELERAYRRLADDRAFHAELDGLLKHYVGRPSPVTEARRLAAHYGRGRIALKREDLNHTGSHKINNALGQVLLAKRMGKTRIIAETGAGQHGVATATACALLGLPCVVYQGREDMQRQALNVFRMRLLGAEVRGVDSGTRTLKDALNEALRDWVANVEDTHYVIGSVAGPHPFPALVRDLQAVIGREAKEQCVAEFGRLPGHVVACVGGGSNAMGIFHEFRAEAAVRLIGVEAAGHGLDSSQHSATLAKGSVGVLHGSRSYVLQDDEGQIQGAHSVAPGLDYPGVGPEHAYLKESGRATYETVTDDEALDAFVRLSRLEGIIPALESSHAVAYLERLMPGTSADDLVLVCLSGRGDKDVQAAMPLLEGKGAL